MGVLNVVVPAVAAATLMSCAAAQSIASCSVSLSGGGILTESLSATAEASATATAELICGGDIASVEAESEAIAEAIAFAAAQAIANASVDCFTTGDSAFTVDGVSIAVAQAEAYAAAFADASASSMTQCAQSNCSVAAEFVAEAFTTIFAEAVAIAEVSLDSSSPIRSVEVFANNVTNVTATVLAVAVATAVASVEEGCSLELLGLVEAGNDSSFCNIQAATFDNSSATDAFVEVIEDVIAVSACDSPAQNITNVTGSALAEAFANVLAGVAAFCDSLGNSSICFAAEANISAIVEASAEAFAFGFLNASSTCENMLCETSLEVLTEAVNSVVAEAATSAIAIGCADSNNQTVDLVNITEAFVSNTSLALASIIANATVVGGECFIDVDITASTEVVLPVLPPPMMNTTMNMTMNTTDPMMNTTMNTTDPMMNMTDPMMNMTDPMMNMTDPGPVCPPDSDCIRNNRQCAGAGFDVALACCSPEYLCVRRNDRFAQCRLNGEPGLASWEGSILPCGVASDAVIAP